MSARSLFWRFGQPTIVAIAGARKRTRDWRAWVAAQAKQRSGAAIGGYIKEERAPPLSIVRTKDGKEIIQPAAVANAFVQECGNCGSQQRSRPVFGAHSTSSRRRSHRALSRRRTWRERSVQCQGARLRA